MSRIVVALDASPASAAALAEAIQLASAGHSQLVLAHVTSVADTLSTPLHKPYRVPDVTTTVLAAARTRAHAAGVEATTELLLGHPPRQLALLADDIDADLIVVGTRNLQGMKRAVLGSVSSELLRKSHRPVLIVRAPTAAEAVA